MAKTQKVKTTLYPVWKPHDFDCFFSHFFVDSHWLRGRIGTIRDANKLPNLHIWIRALLPPPFSFHCWVPASMCTFNGDWTPGFAGYLGHAIKRHLVAVLIVSFHLLGHLKIGKYFSQRFTRVFFPSSSFHLGHHSLSSVTKEILLTQPCSTCHFPCFQSFQCNLV